MGVAPIGAPAMLNAGGAVARCGRGRRQWAGAAHKHALWPGALTAGMLPCLPVCSCGWDDCGSEDGKPAAQPGRRARYCLCMAAAGGVLVYSSAAPASVEAEGGGIRFQYDAASGALRFEPPPGIPHPVHWALLF